MTQHSITSSSSSSNSSSSDGDNGTANKDQTSQHLLLTTGQSRELADTLECHMAAHGPVQATASNMTHDITHVMTHEATLQGVSHRELAAPLPPGGGGG
jgi:hypothetical protein